MDLCGSGSGGGEQEEWGEVKLQSGCIVSEKN